VTWLVAGASLTATWLNIRKLRISFAIWFFTNAAWCVVDVLHGRLGACASRRDLHGPGRLRLRRVGEEAVMPGSGPLRRPDRAR
jgi:hypothetical protein